MLAGRLCDRDVSVFRPGNPDDPRGHAARGDRRNQVLHHSEVGETA